MKERMARNWTTIGFFYCLCLRPPVVSSQEEFEISLLNKPVYQSSITHSGVPRRAIDGDTDGHYNSRSCTHTAKGSGQWWIVDLETSYQIDKVVIYNRVDDCCRERLRRATVRIGEQQIPNNPMCGNAVTRDQITGGPMITIPCNMQVGRFLSIEQPRNEYLTLCEVKLYGSIPVESTTIPLLTTDTSTTMMLTSKESLTNAFTSEELTTYISMVSQKRTANKESTTIPLLTTDTSTTMMLTSKESLTNAFTSEELTTYISMVSQKRTANKVVAPVVSSVVLILFAVLIIILGVFILRRRKQQKSGDHSQVDLRLENQGVMDENTYSNSNDVIPGKNTTDEEGLYANVASNNSQNRNDSLVEIYATSDYGSQEPDSNYAYANSDVITEPTEDDYAYAASDSYPVTSNTNKISENPEEEGWKENEIYASEDGSNPETTTEDDYAYATSDFVTKDTNEKEKVTEEKGWKENEIYASEDGSNPETTTEDDYAYATSDFVTKDTNDVDKVAEVEGWEENDIYASEDGGEGWEDNTIYVETN